MCSISGTLGIMPENNRRQVIETLRTELSHRGPDGSNFYIDNHVSLVHNRLSIIDLSPNGNQPLYNEDRTVVLICNGEIYNYKELRSQLLSSGHHFSSESDSEVILHLYEDNKDNPSLLLNKLIGMFAFALWDTTKQEMLLARDRIGIKPLYYSYTNGILSFASEVRPLSLTGLVPTDLDYSSVYEYFLNGTIPSPNTLYEYVKCVEPGSYIIANIDSIKANKYWEIPHNAGNWHNSNEIEEAVEALLNEVIKDHLVADVPVGTFLSAGVDSSIISALAVKYHPGILSFTATFPGEPEDEGTIAQSTAKRLNTTHHNYALKGDFFDKFDEQFQLIDQPFGITSALSLGRISQKAKEYVKVVLSGDGGDELFGGYNRHAMPELPKFLKAIPTPFHVSFLKVAAAITGKKSLLTLKDTLNIKEADIFMARTSTSLPHVALSFINRDLHHKVDTERYHRHVSKLFDNCATTDKLNRILYVDVKTTLVDEMLTKCDRFTMINGIEGRVPLLDHRIVELAFSIPGKNKRNGENGKIPLRNILAKHLGKELAYREKTGFNSPLKQWLKTDNNTKAVAATNMKMASKLHFLNSEQILPAIVAPEVLRTTEVFGLMCMGKYFK